MSENQNKILKVSDFIVYSEQVPGTVVFSNYDELKEKLINQLEYYNNCEYNLDNYDLAVVNRDTLRRVKRSLESKKREIEHIYNAPFVDVEKKLVELIDLVKKPFKEVDCFIKENEKLSKRIKILNYARKAAIAWGIEEYAESIINSPAFFKQRWLLKSCSTWEWMSAIDKIMANAEKDISHISNSDNKYSAALFAHYFESLSLERATEFISTLISAENTQKEKSPFAETTGVIVDGEILDFDCKSEKAILTDEYILSSLENGINPFTNRTILGIDKQLIDWIRSLMNSAFK